MTSISLDDFSSAVSAGVAVAGLLGSGIAFLWVRVEWNNRKIRKELDHCREREHLARERRGILMTVIELLWQEVQRLVPHNDYILTRAKQLLDEIKHADEQAKAVQDAENNRDK